MGELYEPLPSKTIRLLRVLPGESKECPIQCELLLFPLPETTHQMQLYEALSYVWGSVDTPHSILVSGRPLHVGQNLYQALIRLRHRVLDTVLWIDAICINQADTREKEQQIPLMWHIYHQAGRVIVWLGEEDNNSTQALEAIVSAGANQVLPDHLDPWEPYGPDSQDQPKDLDVDDAIEGSILDMFTRPWFRRIWILQEISSSRHTLMLCGSAEVHGYAFSQGVLALVDWLKRFQDVSGWVLPVAKLMATATLESSRACVRPLGELVSMYHSRESTIRHDMLYALQGLSSENFEDIGILIDYSEEWHIVFQKLLSFLLTKAVNLHISADASCACMEHAAKLVSEIIYLKDSTLQGGHQIVKARTYASILDNQDQIWHLPYSANPVAIGDFICLFEDTMNPAVVRVQGDYFEVIIIALSWIELVSPTISAARWRQSVIEEKEFTPLPFIWDWRDHMRVGRNADHQDLLRVVLDLDELVSPQEVSLAYLKRVSRISSAILNIFQHHECLPTAVEEARLESYKAYNNAHALLSDCVNEVGLPPLTWATLNGYDQLARDLVQDGADVNLRDYDGRAALSYAAECGNADLAQFYLDNGAVIHAFRGNRPNPKVERGRDSLAQILQYVLDKNRRSQHRLFLSAVWSGEIDAISCLLSYGFDINTGSVRKLPSLREPTSHMMVDWDYLFKFKDTEFVECMQQTRGRFNPLIVAIKRDSERMVRFLVGQGADPHYSEDHRCHSVPFFYAFDHGKVTMLSLLLSLGANTNWRDATGSGPLHYLASSFEEHPDTGAAIARLLLENGSDINAVDEDGETPLMVAVRTGALDIVALLIRKGADVNKYDLTMKTSLAHALMPGSERLPSSKMIKLLLEHGAKLEDAPGFYLMAKEKGLTPEQMWPEVWPETGHADESPSGS